MGWWRRLTGRDDADAGSGRAEPHAVLVTFRLAGSSPTESEVREANELAEMFQAALDGVGAYESGDWGQGAITHHLTGPDAEAIWQAIMPVLEGRPARKGSVAIKRFGGPGAKRTERINLHWDG